ncbi:MAG: RagB/SusD family nutrient uptake outer membrane protein [Segetibacter sp.]
MAFNELPSDNTTIDFNPGDRGQAPAIEAFEFWQVNGGTGNIAGMYNNYYSALYNINNTLAKLEASTIADSVKTPSAGQLKFFRAYYYFELTQYFGDVVLITEPILDEPSKAWNYLREPQEKSICPN